MLAGRDRRVTAVYPVPNAAEDRVARYEMAPAELWAARRGAGAEGLEVLGFYHSHPRTPPLSPMSARSAWRRCDGSVRQPRRLPRR